jgi:hypothetical protein
MDCLFGGVRRSVCNIFEISFATWFLSILFLIFESEERASNKAKAKYGHPPQRGAEASSSSKRNKWGKPVGGTVYAGFELEVAGAGALLAEDEA